MKRRWGLQAKMSASYVLVTAAAVVLVEIAVLGFVVPRVVQQVDPQTLVQLTADRYATTAMRRNATLHRLPRAGELQLGDPALRLAPGEVRLTPDRDGVQIPYAPTRRTTPGRCRWRCCSTPTGGCWSAPTRPATGPATGSTWPASAC